MDETANMTDRKPRTTITLEERSRRDASVLRCIRETPNLSAKAVASRLGWDHLRAARDVRECIRRLRGAGERIAIAPDGKGYTHLDCLADDTTRALYAKTHWLRTRAYMIDHCTLMKQIGHYTTLQLAQAMLFDAVVPAEPGTALHARPVTMADLAKLPPERRTGVFTVVGNILRGIAEDPSAFAAERAALGEEFRAVFLTAKQLAAIKSGMAAMAEAGI